jgi:hypothetical protein
MYIKYLKLVYTHQIKTLYSKQNVQKKIYTLQFMTINIRG